MAVSMEQVRAVLDPDETDYAAAQKLGPECLPHLRSLVLGGEPMIASKAAYLAGLFEGETANEVLERAAESKHENVRIAVACVLQRSRKEHAANVLPALLRDVSVSVRMVAMETAARATDMTLIRILEQARDSDESEHVRERADAALKALVK